MNYQVKAVRQDGIKNDSALKDTEKGELKQISPYKFSANLIDLLEKNGYQAKVNTKSELPGVIEILINGAPFSIHLVSNAKMNVKIKSVEVAGKKYMGLHEFDKNCDCVMCKNEAEKNEIRGI